MYSACPVHLILLDLATLTVPSNNWKAIFSLAVPLHAMETLGERGGIAPTHS
jgi:hypothetical protein